MNRILKTVLIAVVVVAAWQYGGFRSEPSVAGKLAEGNEVIMYSLTTCGYCTDKRRRFSQAGIPFREYFVDSEPSRMQELSVLLQENGVPPGGVGTPTLLVNGTLLVNNPSMDTIRRHLKFRG